QIVQGNTVGPQQIQLVGSVVVEAVQLQLSHSQPLEIECERALLSLVDAADLDIVVGHTGSLMSVGVQDYGNFAGEFFGLVQQRGDPQARDYLVTEAFDAIAFAGKYVQPFHASLGFGPLVALSAQNHFVQQL